MSSSRIYKERGSEELQLLRFAEFDGGGGGGTVAVQSFAPVAMAAPTARGVALAGADNGQRKVEEAYARGRQEGLAQAEERFGELGRAFAAAVEDIGRLRESILKNSTDDMLRLVLAVARQVVQVEIAGNPQIVLETLKRALKAAVRSDEYHIRLHPQDLALVSEHKPLLLASVSGLRNITLEADPGLARGGCLVESNLGQVDASIDSQLEEIREKLQLAVAGG
jgi:flagellar assembly protein FliH